MSFLVPAFLAGLAALAIPILVHLTRKQRERVVDFPSLMFLGRVPFHEDRKRRIHHWLLLSLRALALALLVAAFARPFLEDDEAGALAASGPAERVIVVDRSWSMGAGERWERAVEAAAAAAERAGPLDRVSLVTFGQGAGAPVRSSGDPRAVRSALDTGSVGFEATRYGPALKLAQTILEESELPRGELVLVSDFQKGGWSGDEGVRLPPGTEVRPVDVGHEAAPDASVTGVELARDVFQGRERITPTARFARTGGDEPLEVRAVLELDGREIQTREVTLPATGAVPVTFQPFTLDDRHTRGTVRLVAGDGPGAGDALPPNDARHFVLTPGRALRVLILERGGAPAETSLYLRRALDIDRGSRFQVEVRPLSGGAVTDADEHAVVVLNDVPFPTGEAGRRLRDFVQAGGGLVVVAGARARWPGADPLFPGTLGPARDRLDAGGGRLGHLEYDHPVFSTFRGPRSGDFTGARFFRHRSLEPADSARVLARFDDGAPALVESRSGEGRVLVWTSTLDALWNDLTLQPVFLPFAHRLVRHASGRGETVEAFTVGQVVDVSDARSMATAGLLDGVDADVFGRAERVALTPGGGAVAIPAGEGPHYLHLDEAGFYRIRPPGETGSRPLAVAVNVDLAEADTASLDPQEMVAGLVVESGSASAPSAAGGGERAEALMREDRERRQSLWRFLLAGAFGLLVLETVLSNRRSAARGPRAAARA